MSHKRILLLNGHPAERSLSQKFILSYAKAAEASGHDVRTVHIRDLDFDPDYGFGGYTNHKPLEPDLEAVLKDLEWSEHLVLATPLWWGGLPAKFKGLIDRAFLPGKTFDTRNTTLIGLPKPLLTGKTARVIVTADTPGWFLRIFYKNAILNQLKGQILGFVGFKPVRFTYFAGASHPKEGQIDKWASMVEALGAQAA